MATSFPLQPQDWADRIGQALYAANSTGEMVPIDLGPDSAAAVQEFHADLFEAGILVSGIRVFRREGHTWVATDAIVMRDTLKRWYLDRVAALEIRLDQLSAQA